MTRLAEERGAVNLSQGFPDFDGPDFVKEAAIAAVRDGKGQYARMSGIPEVHEALAAKYRRDYGLSYASGTEITVTSGATEAIFASIQGTCNPGDEVLLFEPYYDSYKPSVAMAGAVARVVTLRAPDWSFDRAEVERAITPRTRAILVNTPHNPTGKVFSRGGAGIPRRALPRARSSSASPTRCTSTSSTTARTCRWRRSRGCASGRSRSPRFGKTFSLTGWKIGWAAAPRRADRGGRARPTSSSPSRRRLRSSTARRRRSPRRPDYYRAARRGIPRAPRLPRGRARAHRVRRAEARRDLLPLRRLHGRSASKTTSPSAGTSSRRSASRRSRPPPSTTTRSRREATSASRSARSGGRSTAAVERLGRLADRPLSDGRR